MQKKNIIRSLGSFMLFPAMTLSMPVGPVPSQQLDIAPHQIILAQLNTESSAEKAIKEAEAKKAQILKAQADAIDAYFASIDAPLEGYGRKMVEEADKNGIHPFLMPAIVTRESTAGKKACTSVKNNSFGWHSCKRGFNSVDESIEVVARHLAGKDKNTAKYYANKDIKGILQAYNPPSIVEKYADQVMAIMKKIEAKQIVQEANT